MNEFRRCVIVSAGEMSDHQKMKVYLFPDDFIIAADGGIGHLNRMSLAPNIFLGDMDSVKEGESVPKEAEIFPVQKDDTDTMLAVKEGLRRGYKRFLLLGALGGRLDHSFANIQTLAYLMDHSAYGEIRDENHRIFMLENGNAVVGNEYANVSVFSYSENCSGITIKDMEYPLTDASLHQGFPLGVSNHPLNENAEISVRSGRLLLILSNG